jgi:anti-sigma factor RsiW
MPVGARRASPSSRLASPSSGCAGVRARLELLADGELDAGTAADLRAHVARCPDCRAQHREAVSLPARLRALRSPDPPPSLVDNVMRRVAPGSRALEVWGLLVPEVVLVLVAAWYTSGIGGLLEVARRTASDAGAFLNWGTGGGSPPAPVPGDLFLLLVTLLIAALSLWHLSLLARQAPKQTTL